MLRYTVSRLVQLVPVVFGISVVVFFGLHVVPGDVAQLILGDKGSQADLERLRHELGLDKPVYVQYAIFLKDALRGDFGRSLRTQQPALYEIEIAFPVTVQLTVAALAIATVVGIPAGVLAARKQYSLFDSVTMTSVLVGVSMPIFWTGLILLIVFGGKLHWLPLGGMLDQGVRITRITGVPALDAALTGNWAGLTSALRHLVLPALALSSAPMAIIARMTRATMVEVLAQDYVRTARAKGLTERAVTASHALRNALIPIVTVIGLQLGLLLSGAVLTETVFAIPGLGRLAVTSILARDYPVIQALVIISAVVIVLINFAVDLLYAYLDPRIKYGAS
ncbi:MAG: ABC transporter permease [Thermomicrobiaceae bacterium]|nr:ABC transporter permease [Thermomicrobiaceae bacterium]